MKGSLSDTLQLDAEVVRSHMALHKRGNADGIDVRRLYSM
eukprot:SAG31_NODE_4016_length_3662_cov_3.395453_1_plen_40_part_00